MLAFLSRYRSLPWLLASSCFFLVPIIETLWWLFLPGIVLLLVGLHLAKSRQEAFFGSLLTAAMKAAGASAWVWSTYPFVWLDLEPGFVQLLIIGAYWLIVSVFFGLGLALAWCAYYELGTKFAGAFWLAPAFAGLWVIGEVLGSLSFSVFTLGPGSYINAYFSFGYLGYSVSHLAALYPLAVWGGVYLLTLAAALFGALVYFALVRANARPRYFWTLFLLAAGVLVWRAFTPAQTYQPIGQTIIAIDTNFDTPFVRAEGGQKAKTLALLPAISLALVYEPDFILLPEDARLTLNFGGSEAVLDYLSQFKKDVYLVDTSRFEDERGLIIERGFYYSLADGRVYETDKQYLTPQGEYIPHIIAVLLSLFGHKEFLKEMESDQNYHPGNLKGHQGFPEELPGILFCSESVSPLSVRQIAKERGAPFVLHPISHGRFHEPEILWRQLGEMLRVQSIWNNKVIVEAANMARGRIFYPDGSTGGGRVLAGSAKWRLVEYGL